MLCCIQKWKISFCQVKIHSTYKLNQRKGTLAEGLNERVMKRSMVYESIGGADHKKAAVLYEVSHCCPVITTQITASYSVSAGEAIAQKVPNFEDDFKEDLLSICEVRGACFCIKSSICNDAFMLCIRQQKIAWSSSRQSCQIIMC